MRGSEFKKLAQAGCREYGQDPWFFIRELCQNSRDAGATRIQVRALELESSQTITFSDNGLGMGLAHAREFLFRLYASEKPSQRFAAGRFGIGFWTVLGFMPARLVVESRTSAEAWAIALDQDLKAEQVPCNLSHRGTRITLIRNAIIPSFEADARAAVLRYGAHLRRNDRSYSPLEVWFQEERMDSPLELPGMPSISFSRGPSEGVVGLARIPQVRLLARGLPVWEGMTLDELSHMPPRDQSDYGLSLGCAPVFVLNGNDLDVVMDRRKVVDNRALQRLKRTALKALDRLVRNQFKGHRGLTGRWPALAAWLELLRQNLGFLVLAVGLAVLAAVLILTVLPPGPRGNAPAGAGDQAAAISRDSGTEPAAPEVAHGTTFEPLAAYAGATVEPDQRLLPDFSMTYGPGKPDAWFKLVNASTYHPIEGLVREEEELTSGSPEICASCPQPRLQVRLALESGGLIPLPLPASFSLAGPLLLDGSRLDQVLTDPGGQVFLRIPRRGGVLEYTCAPSSTRPDPAEAGELEAPPDLLELLPPEVAGRLLRGRSLPVPQRVALAVELTRELVAYDRSPETVRAFRSPGAAGWLSRVLELGRGDCDVLNTVTVLMLRAMEVPARLSIGLVGSKGLVEPGLHAWTEYLDDWWQTVDSSFEIVTVPPETVAPVASPREVPRAPGLMPRPVVRIAGPGEAPSAGISPPAPRTDELTREVIAQVSRASSPSRESLSSEPWIPAGLLLLGAALLVGGLLRLRGRAQWSAARDGTGSRDETLAQLGVTWLMRKSSLGLRRFGYYPLLPTLGRTRTSLVRALDLANRGRLFLGSEDNPIARRLAARHRVLSSSSREFHQVHRMLPGLQNLDILVNHQPRRPALDSGNQVQRLLARLNEVLDKVAPGIICLVPTLRDNSLIVDVDLSRAGARIRGELPPRFVLTGTRLAGMADLDPESPAAIYQALALLTMKSPMLYRSRGKLLPNVARFLLERGQAGPRGDSR